MAAFGTTIREEQFSISANICIDSPGEGTHLFTLRKQISKHTLSSIDFWSSTNSMEEKLSYRSKRGNCHKNNPLTQWPHKKGRQSVKGKWIRTPPTVLLRNAECSNTEGLYRVVSKDNCFWGHQPHTYLGCSPSSRFWHLRIWGLRCRTSNRVSCLLCLLGVTGRNREKTSMYELIRMPECSKSQLREPIWFPKHVFKIIPNISLYKLLLHKEKQWVKSWVPYFKADF